MNQPDYVTDAAWRYLEPNIDHAWEALAARHPAFLAHERFVRARLAQLAHRAYQHGMREAYRQLRTSDEVAAELGIKRRTVQHHAARRQIGWQIGRDILFRPEDVVRLRDYVGRGPGPRPAGDN